jgi:hypothetical protein
MPEEAADGIQTPGAATAESFTSADLPGAARAAEREPEESRTRGMLRDAISKVMDEIAHHEKEAKRHLQMAAALRKDLRDSFAFLQERRSDGKAAEPPPEARAAQPAEPGGKVKAEDKPHHGRKKHAGKSRGK